MEYSIAPTTPRPGQGSTGFDPRDQWRGPNYVFTFNDSTGLGDLVVGRYNIALAEGDARLFATADEPLRQSLIKRLVEAHEGRTRKVPR